MLTNKTCKCHGMEQKMSCKYALRKSCLVNLECSGKTSGKQKCEYLVGSEERGKEKAQFVKYAMYSLRPCYV